MKSHCFYNGKIMPTEKVNVPVMDLAVLRGYGVFDFLKTINGKPFLWKEHWKRFQNSAKLLGLKVPVSEKAARTAVTQLLKKNGGDNLSIRLLLTGGVAKSGLEINKPNFFIISEPLYIFPKKAFEQGAKLMSCPHERLVPEAKTTNYLTAVRLQKERIRQGATEIIYFKNGKISECSTSNFFLVKEGRLITARDGVLGGTIRNLVIELAKKAGIAVEEREVAQPELASADEAFLTATNKDVMPVVQVDDIRINDGKPGPITRQLQSAFAEYVKNY